MQNTTQHNILHVHACRESTPALPGSSYLIRLSLVCVCVCVWGGVGGGGGGEYGVLDW